jgi:hypothetical protein
MWNDIFYFYSHLDLEKLATFSNAKGIFEKGSPLGAGGLV